LRWDADIRMLVFEGIYFVSTALALLYATPRLDLSTFVLGFWLWFWSFVGAVAVHNCVHTPPFKVAWMNSVWSIVLSLTIGLPVSTYVPGHNFSHHRYIETRKDIMRTVQMTYKWNVLNLLLFFPSISIQTQRNDARYFMAQREKGRPIWHQVVLEACCWWASYAILAILSPSQFVFWVLLPHLFAKDAIVSLNMLQHDCCDPNSKHDFARNFVGPVVNFFCYNNGYHTIHHMFPGKHWSTLKAEHDEKVKPFNHRNLNRENILGYMFEAYVYPGRRVMYDGSEFVLPADATAPLIDWAVDAKETHDG